jgi:hypothetical protein
MLFIMDRMKGWEKYLFCSSLNPQVPVSPNSQWVILHDATFKHGSGHGIKPIVGRTSLFKESLCTISCFFYPPLSCLTGYDRSIYTCPACWPRLWSIIASSHCDEHFMHSPHVEESGFLWVISFFFSYGAEDWSWGLCMLGRYSPSELYSQPLVL